MTEPIAHYPFAVTAQTAAATADTGPGSGWVSGDAEFVQITSSSSAKFVILSDKFPVGRFCYMNVGANGYKLGTPAGSSLTINNVDTSGATASATIPANTTAFIMRTLSTGFILSNYTNLGAVATAIVPS
jgi:hypothetical protein